MIYRIDVQITTSVNPTEASDRVEDAIHAIFPGAEIERAHGELVARTRSVERFAERLREQEIVDAAREVLRSGRDGDAIAFDLRKQPAHEGVVNFAVDEPGELGALHVRIRVDEPSVPEFIDHVAPGTE